MSLENIQGQHWIPFPEWMHYVFMINLIFKSTSQAKCTMGNHHKCDKCQKIKLISICNGNMSENCSHNQLFMTKYPCRTDFCKIEAEKRPKYVISIFHRKLTVFHFKKIIPKNDSSGSRTHDLARVANLPAP